MKQTAEAPAVTPGGQEATATTRGGRFDFLDALRGIAAVLVVIEHIDQQLRWHPVTYFTSHLVQLGQLGVTIFFFVSGFIIPVSIERHGNLKSFWVARVFRLYPLYWFSLATIFILWLNGLAGVDKGIRAHPWPAFLANFTMASRIFRQPYAIGIYWTLIFELAFYLACSALFAVGWLKHTNRIALVLMAAVVAKTYGPVLYGGHASPSALPFVAMFTGTVLYRVFSGAMTRRQAAPVLIAAAVTAVVASAPLIGKLHRARNFGGDAFTPMVASFLIAMVVVLVGMALRGRSVPWVLTHLGLVSYSIYIVHPLLLGQRQPTHPVHFIPKPGNQLWWITLPDNKALATLIFVLVVIAVSTVTYKLIEAPAINAGRRIVRRLERHPAPEIADTVAP